MSDPLESWLERVPAFAGLLRAFAVAPQRELLIRSWSEEHGVEEIRALHRVVHDVVEVLEARQMPARKLRWIFGQTVIYFERRKDGAAMCLITTREPWVGESEYITELIAEFRYAV